MTQKEFSEKKMNNVMSQATEWSSEFKKSTLFKKMSASAQTNSEPVTVAFSEQMYLVERRTGREWTAGALETILMTSFPTEVAEYDKIKADISEVLTNYFSFLKEEKKISNADTLNRKLATLHFSDKDNTEEMVVKKSAKVATPKKQASKKGNSTYSDKEIERFNQFVMGSVLTEIRGGSKAKEESEPETTEAEIKPVGRNELCPCGSGKKYKKCHGK